MTPPDSGEHRAWCSGGRIDRHGTRLGCDCKPDSGEREVWMAKKECPRCHGVGLVTMPPIPIAQVSLPLSLAQRILAALEECGEVVGPGIIFPRHTAIADELRAVIPTADPRKGP